MYNIAIDGPSGAGKSTVAKSLATRLKILYLDTGALYRAIGLKCLKNDINLDKTQDIIDISDNSSVDIIYKDGEQRIILDGKDVSEEIRKHEVSHYASKVSAIPKVRLKLLELQREIAKRQNTVLDGRDIGTVVLPDARFKFFLTADLDVRAQRRTMELLNKGQEADFHKIRADIEKRDKDDISRMFAPLKKADDATMIDSTNLTVERVVEMIANQVKKELDKDEQ